MAVNAHFLLCAVMLCGIIAGHVTQGADLVRRFRRSTSLSCAANETHIYGPLKTATGSDCGTVIGQPPDLFDVTYREECQRWMGGEVPYMLGNSKVSFCVENGDGTVTHRDEICCPGVVTGLRCFSCSNSSSNYECNFVTGSVVDCAADEVCQTTYASHDNYPDTVRLVSKFCQSSTVCEAISADNANCDWLPAPSCSYCCQDSFCNYQAMEPFVYIDKCDFNPCENGGVCTSLVNGYSCLCAAGYTGAICQTSMDKCDDNPCLNGAVCTSLVNGFSCQCAAGYTGTTCEISDYPGMDKCDDNPCLNGAVCTSLVNGFSCQCAAGYTGTTCEISDYPGMDECDDNPCLNGAVCISLVNGFSCQCAAGYTGTTCEISDYPGMDECDHNPCLNGAVCTSLVDGFSCQCAAGYTGTTCEISDYPDMDECDDDPCLNGGVCTSLVNGYSCLCAAGYTGTHCETSMD